MILPTGAAFLKIIKKKKQELQKFRDLTPSSGRRRRSEGLKPFVVQSIDDRGPLRSAALTLWPNTAKRQTFSIPGI